MPSYSNVVLCPSFPTTFALALSSSSSSASSPPPPLFNGVLLFDDVLLEICRHLNPSDVLAFGIVHGRVRVTIATIGVVNAIDVMVKYGSEAQFQWALKKYACSVDSTIDAAIAFGCTRRFDQVLAHVDFARRSVQFRHPVYTAIHMQRFYMMLHLIRLARTRRLPTISESQVGLFMSRFGTQEMMAWALQRGTGLAIPKGVNTIMRINVSKRFIVEYRINTADKAILQWEEGVAAGIANDIDHIEELLYNNRLTSSKFGGALVSAIACNHVEFAAMLIEDAPVDGVRHFMCEAYLATATSGNVDVVRMLRARDEDGEDGAWRNTLFHVQCIERGHLDILVYLMSTGDMKIEPRLFIRALQHRQWHIVKWWIYERQMPVSNESVFYVDTLVRKRSLKFEPEYADLIRRIWRHLWNCYEVAQKEKKKKKEEVTARQRERQRQLEQKEKKKRKKNKAEEEKGGEEAAIDDKNGDPMMVVDAVADDNVPKTVVHTPPTKMAVATMADTDERLNDMMDVDMEH